MEQRGVSAWECGVDVHFRGGSHEDWTEHRTTSRRTRLVCASHRCPGKGAGRGSANQHSSAACRPWQGTVSFLRKESFLFAQMCHLPAKPTQRGARSKSHTGAVLPEVALVAGHWNDRERWIVPVFMVRPRSFGLYFLTTRVS